MSCVLLGSARGVVANVLDFSNAVNKFEFESLYLHSLTEKYTKERYEPLYPPAMILFFFI